MGKNSGKQPVISKQMTIPVKGARMVAVKKAAGFLLIIGLQRAADILARYA